jgi:histidinol phosphatase-like PHP family hydrolase
MYNLHCHTLLSDGALLPSEIAVRYLAAGYKAIAITDHADYSNIEPLIKATLEFTTRWPKDSKLRVLAGIELTHIVPEHFKHLAQLARAKGAQVIIGHGETPVEPVINGTNRAALESDIDILAHPGLITDNDTKLAAEKNIFLEVTSRKGHNRTNKHVVKQAKKFGAKLIINMDSHEPKDIISCAQLIKAARASGLSAQDIDRVFSDTEEFIKRQEAG